MALKEFLSGFSYNSIAEWLATIDLHLLMKYKINGWPFSVSPLCRALGSCSHLFLLSHREIVWILEILPDCSNKNSSCSISPLFALQEIHECSLMFSSGVGKRVQINEACGRLLAKGSVYPWLLPPQNIQECFMGKLPRQDTRWAKKHAGNSVILVLFLIVLKIRSYRILNSLLIRDWENELDVSVCMPWHKMDHNRKRRKSLDIKTVI